MMFLKGLTKDTVMEYLEVIQGMEQIELDAVNDKIRKPKV
jgi:hypothetical protein